MRFSSASVGWLNMASQGARISAFPKAIASRAFFISGSFVAASRNVTGAVCGFWEGLMTIPRSKNAFCKDASSGELSQSQSDVFFKFRYLSGKPLK